MPAMKFAASVSLVALALAGCATSSAAPPPAAVTADPAVSAPAAVTAADADAFVAAAEKELSDLSLYVNKAGWINATYITEDTDWLAAKAGAEFTKAQVRLASEAAKLDRKSVV